MNITALTSSGIGRWLRNRPPADILRFCNDTRNLLPGECFVALVTEKRDGHDFLRDAKDRGASCAIVSRPDPTMDLPQFICQDTLVALDAIARLFRSAFTGTTIAITGSFGKTTTKDMVKLLFGIENNATVETQNAKIGIAATLAMLRNTEKFAAIEVGVGTPNDIDAVADLVRPDVAIVTGIGKIHLSGMKNETAIADEKCKLVTLALDRHGIGIFSDECLRFDAFRRVESRCTVPLAGGKKFGYAVDKVNGNFVATVTHDGRAQVFPMPRSMSRGTTKNFVLVCTYALGCGIDGETIREKIARWKPSKLRGEIIETDGRIFFADCFNATPRSFVDSLENFDRLFPHGNRLFLIGLFTEEALWVETDNENAVLCKNLPLRDGDRVVLIGKGSDRLAEGLDWPLRQSFSTTEKAIAAVKNFHGVVYAKGHRAYQLENLIS